MIKNNCRICGRDHLQPILDLGHQPPSDAFLTLAQLSEPEAYYPLALEYCDDCDFFQINYVVHLDILYNKAYPYRTGDNEQGREHFLELANIAVTYFPKQKSALHVDIGGNDGTLCQFMEGSCKKTINVDPSGIDPEAMKASLSPHVATHIVKSHGQADVITATNVLAHVDNLTSFLKAVKALLAPEGIFIVEVPDAMKLINTAAYDTIYHEHLSYFTSHSMIKLMQSNGLEVTDATELEIHGGSIRYYIRHKGYKNLPPLHCTKVSPNSIKMFQEVVANQATDFRNWLINFYNAGKMVVGLSAPAKGNTILNTCRITPNLIRLITEKPGSPKIGLYTPGTHIPVLSDDALDVRVYDIGIIFAWNWKDQIMEAARSHGFKGDFLIPIPTPKFEGDTKPFEGFYYGHKQ